MTSRDSEREAMVDELLLDADAADSSDLRLALLSMGSFANLAAPTPGAELSAMLAGPHDEVSKRRWRHKHRTAVVGVAVVAAMGLGISGVAASSSGFTRNPSFINELLGNVQPQPAAAAPVLPLPDAPRIITEPAPAVDPAAIPALPPAGSLPVPGSVAPAETPAQAQAQAPVVAHAPAAAPEQPSSGSAPQLQPNTSPNPAPNLQPKPGTGKDEKQQAARPDTSLQGTAKPAKTVPGADEAKPGHLPPGPGNERAEEQLKDAANKWKQWLKRGDH